MKKRIEPKELQSRYNEQTHGSALFVLHGKKQINVVATDDADAPADTTNSSQVAANTKILKRMEQHTNQIKPKTISKTMRIGTKISERMAQIFE